jgi:hypothetical protein
MGSCCAVYVKDVYNNNNNKNNNNKNVPMLLMRDQSGLMPLS